MSERPAPLSGVPEDDLAWCHETVQDVSRTFAITIDVLDEPMSSWICIGYLLCRIPDTIEDAEALSADEKVELLERYDAIFAADAAADADAGEGTEPAADDALDAFERAVEPFYATTGADAGATGPDAADDTDATGADAGDTDAIDTDAADTDASDTDATDDEWTLVANADRVIRTFRRLPPDVRAAIVPPTRELVQGQTTFVRRYADSGGIRIQTVAELEEYCYYVAGTVGHLVTNLVGRRTSTAVTDELRRSSEEFGTLLQLVNVAKDVHADYERENNVYLPAAWLEEAGVPQDEVLATDHGPAVASVVERTADHARTFLPDAETYLETLSGVDRNVFDAWAIPFLLAVGTLRELSARPEDALSPAGVKVSRAEVTAIVTAVLDDGGATSIGSLRETVSRGDLG